MSPIVSTNIYTDIFVRVALTGSALIGFICLQQLDIKVIIAYSSVAHIGLVIRGLIYITMFGSLGALSLIIAHGLSSSVIFFGSNTFYLRRHSRRIIITKGLLNIVPLISFF